MGATRPSPSRRSQRTQPGPTGPRWPHAPYGPEMAASISSTSLAGTLAPRAPVTVPPPAGTVAVPVELVVALSTATDSVPLAHTDEMPLTVTLMTLVPERFWMTPKPSVSHCPIATPFVPRLLVDQLMPEASPGPASAKTVARIATAPAIPRLHVLIRVGRDGPR